MKQLLSIAILLVGLFPTVGVAATDLDRFAEFFQREIQPKRLLTEIKGKTEDETFLIDYRRVLSFGEMERTKSGIIFDFTADIKQTNTKLDDKGNPTQTVINRDRMVVRKVELSLRQSTGKLVGFARTLSDSSDDPTGDATAVSVEIMDDGKAIELHHSTVLYNDGTLDEKTFLPVASAEVSTLSVEKGGRLKMHQKYMGFRVDVDTYEKTLIDQIEIDSHEMN